MAPLAHLLENRHVLLTGATRGIGRSLALRLADEKVNLSICGRDTDILRFGRWSSRISDRTGRGVTFQRVSSSHRLRRWNVLFQFER